MCYHVMHLSELLVSNIFQKDISFLIIIIIIFTIYQMQYLFHFPTVFCFLHLSPEGWRFFPLFSAQRELVK